jgi:hypothetical protein
MAFVRGTDERGDAHGPRVGPDDAVPPAGPESSSTPGVTLTRSGDWLAALEQTAWPRGIRPDVPQRVSAGTEVAAIGEDIARGSRKLAHAAGGEVITVVRPGWSGTRPGRLRPLAEELGTGRQDGSPPGSGYDPGDLEVLLLIAETALGLSLDERSVTAYPSWGTDTTGTS